MAATFLDRLERAGVALPQSQPITAGRFSLNNNSPLVKPNLFTAPSPADMPLNGPQKQIANPLSSVVGTAGGDFNLDAKMNARALRFAALGGTGVLAPSLSRRSLTGF